VTRRSLAGRRVGELEEAIMAELWSAPEPLTGRELLDRLPGGPRAYTTVMTVLSRLVDKGLVERVAEERTHRYRAAGDPEHLTAQAISQMVTSAADPTAVLAYFVEGIDDPTLIDELVVLVERLREERGGREGREGP